MDYLLFNNTKRVVIDDDLIKKYERFVVPFSAERAEYLAVTSGMDKDSSEEDILKGIIEGINEEVYLYKNRYSILQQAKDKDLIP